MEELKRNTQNYTDTQIFIALIFDEMKIKSNLVFDKHTGELIGFLDLGDMDVNYDLFKNKEKLATHALVFFDRGLAVNLKYS